MQQVYPRIVSFQNGMFTVAFDYDASKKYVWQVSGNGGVTWETLGPVIVNPSGGSANSYNQTVLPSFFTIGIRWLQVA